MNNFIFDLWGSYMALTQVAWLVVIPIIAVVTVIRIIRKR